MPWTVYLVRCRDGSLYTGIARDAARRVEAHNTGRGAAYTRGRLPVTLVHQEPAPDRASALRREWAIKQLTREEKELMVKRLASSGGRTAANEPFTGFRPGALRFFRGLKRRNTKPWFEANRAVYDLEIKRPLQTLVEELDIALAGFAPEILGDPRRSVFRLHRDVRFSKDKSPYKTHAACWFYHADAGRGVGGEVEGGAGFYFQLAPGDSLLGAGIWMPPRPSLNRLRAAIVEDQERFEAILRGPAFRRRYGGLDEEAMLRRLPRGFPEGHPAARWLRYQSFTVGRTLSDRAVLSPRLGAVLARDFAALTPFVRWLNAALGFRTAASRV